MNQLSESSCSLNLKMTATGLPARAACQPARAVHLSARNFSPAPQDRSRTTARESTHLGSAARNCRILCNDSRGLLSKSDRGRCRTGCSWSSADQGNQGQNYKRNLGISAKNEKSLQCEQVR